MPQGRTARHGRLDCASGARPRAVRHGVTAARQPLELLGPGSNPGGGAWTRNPRHHRARRRDGHPHEKRESKVLHPLAGRRWSGTRAAHGERPGRSPVVAVVRHERDQVAADVGARMPGDIVVDQDDDPGHRPRRPQALPALPDDFDEEVVVLAETCRSSRRPLAAPRAALAADAAAGDRALRRVDDPPATDASCATPRRVDRIVEQKDATDDERAIARSTGHLRFGAPAARPAGERHDRQRAGREVPHRRDPAAPRGRLGGRGRARVRAVARRGHQRPRAALRERRARLNALIVRGWQLNGVTIDGPGHDVDRPRREDRARRHHPPRHAAEGRHRRSPRARWSGPTRRSSTARSAPAQR